MSIQMTRRSLAFAAGAFGALLVSSSALAAPSSASSTANSEYQQEVARCNSGQSNEDKATCLKEAGAARAEAQRGGLTSESSATYKQNQLERCKALPPSDQDACRARTEGQGVTQGSVESGGVYREYRQITIPDSPTTNGTP
jgi:hypothetical protein